MKKANQYSQLEKITAIRIAGGAVNALGRAYGIDLKLGTTHDSPDYVVEKVAGDLTGKSVHTILDCHSWTIDQDLKDRAESLFVAVVKAVLEPTLRCPEPCEFVMGGQKNS